MERTGDFSADADFLNTTFEPGQTTIYTTIKEDSFPHREWINRRRD